MLRANGKRLRLTSNGIRPGELLFAIQVVDPQISRSEPAYSAAFPIGWEQENETSAESQEYQHNRQSGHADVGGMPAQWMCEVGAGGLPKAEKCQYRDQQPHECSAGTALHCAKD